VAIDKQRFKEFEKEMRALQEGVSFESYYETFRSKLSDYLAKIEGSARDQTIKILSKNIDQMFSPELAKYTKEVIGNFNSVIDLVNAKYSDIGFDIARDFGKLQAFERLSIEQFGRYRKSTIGGLTKLLRKELIAGKSSKQIAKKIREKFKGKASFYAETIARTSVKGYGRESKHEKSRLGEVFYFEYVGIRRKQTRPFCVHMIGTTHHIDRIKGMRNGNLEPVETYCGGWNCVHDWEPDPFAKEGSEGNWQEVEVGKKKVKLYVKEDLSGGFDEDT
jgi:hypothetical protein